MATEDLLPEHPPGAMRTGNIADELARGGVDLKVTLVSPARPLFEGRAHWIVATGLDGQFGVWPRHMPIVVALGGGPLRIGLAGGEVRHYAVKGGFLEVSHNEVTILVDAAVPKAEAPGVEAAAKAELAETNAELRHPASDSEFEDLLARRGWDQARIDLARKA
ncbi:MAG TPA: ATP synthase F1 subunit epsilon [Actinomycetota bacterium]|nr:ATP synthase F1 subunit epsilon [Actinomycetota bacterium]